MSARLPSMFKTPRHRTFDYKPVIYDAQKERKAELEQLVKENAEGKISDERRLKRLRTNLKRGENFGSASFRKQQTGVSKYRLIAILAALFGLVWLFFNWN